MGVLESDDDMRLGRLRIVDERGERSKSAVDTCDRATASTDELTLRLFPSHCRGFCNVLKFPHTLLHDHIGQNAPAGNTIAFNAYVFPVTEHL